MVLPRIFTRSQVHRRLTISTKELETTPDVCGARSPAFVAGILKIDGKARVIIDAFSLCNRKVQNALGPPQ